MREACQPDLIPGNFEAEVSEVVYVWYRELFPAWFLLNEENIRVTGTAGSNPSAYAGLTLVATIPAARNQSHRFGRDTRLLLQFASAGPLYLSSALLTHGHASRCMVPAQANSYITSYLSTVYGPSRLRGGILLLIVWCFPRYSASTTVSRKGPFCLNAKRNIFLLVEGRLSCEIEDFVETHIL